MFTIKIPKDVVIAKLKEKAGLSEKEIETKVKDKLDQLSGLISEEGALHIIANELGVKIYEDPGNLQIKNIMAGMRNVELTGKVVRVYEVREFSTENRKGKVGAFMLGDETGVIRVVLWNDKTDLLEKLNQGDMIKLENGYTRDNRGRMEVHVGDRTTISVNPSGVDDIDIDVKSRQRKSIAELGENESDVEIMGTIVQVFDPRFFAVDPDTGKRVQEKEGRFYLNDKLIERPAYSYVTNLFLDDGTENIRVVLWRNQTQKLFDMEHEELVKKRDESFEELKTEMLGKIVKFVGRTNRNEMFDRIEFIPNLVYTDPDPKEEAKRLQKEAEKQPKEPVTNKPQEPKTGSYDEKPTETPKQTPQPMAPAKSQQEDVDDIESVEEIDLSDLDSL